MNYLIEEIDQDDSDLIGIDGFSLLDGDIDDDDWSPGIACIIGDTDCEACQ